MNPWPSIPERFWSSFRDAPLGAALLDARGVLLETNPALRRLLGYEAEELAGSALVELAHPMDRSLGQRLVDDVRRGAVGGGSSPARLVHKSGRLTSVALSVVRLPDRTGGTEWLLAVFEDRSEHASVEDALHRLSTTDELTGLFNLRGFRLLAELQWRIARRNRRHLLLLFVDVDGLKRVNDEIGHAAGDALLREVGEVLRGICRDSDVVARVGGDEFVVLAVEAEEASFPIFRQRLEREVLARSGQESRRYPISMSVGMAHFGPEAPHTIDEMLAEADRRMYREKRSRPPSVEAVEASGPAPADSTASAALGRGGAEEELTDALEEVAALALANASYEERLVRIHRRAVTALTRRGAARAFAHGTPGAPTEGEGGEGTDG